MGHKKSFERSIAPPRMPSLTPRGGIGQSGPRLKPAVRMFGDTTFTRPAPPTADRFIGPMQLRKFNRQLAREAQGITRRRGT